MNVKDFRPGQEVEVTLRGLLTDSSINGISLADDDGLHALTLINNRPDTNGWFPIDIKEATPHYPDGTIARLKVNEEVWVIAERINGDWASGPYLYWDEEVEEVEVVPVRYEDSAPQHVNDLRTLASMIDGWRKTQPNTGTRWYGIEETVRYILDYAASLEAGQ